MIQQTFDDYLISPPIGRLTDDQLRAAGWIVCDSEELDAKLREREQSRKGKRKP